VLGDFLRGLQESGPCRAGQRPANADPADARLSELGDRRKVAADEHVDRFGRDGGDDRFDVGEAADARRIEAVGASLGEFAQATDRLAEIWTSRDEAFGPVAVVRRFEGIDEALALANDSPFGLQGAVFTSNLATAYRFADDFDVGSLWINEASRFRLDAYPFGGVKRSGFGREGLRYAMEDLSQVKFIGIRADVR